MTYTGTPEELEALGYQMDYMKRYYFKSLFIAKKNRRYDFVTIFIEADTREISIEGNTEYKEILLKEIE